MFSLFRLYVDDKFLYYCLINMYDIELVIINNVYCFGMWFKLWF